MSAGLLTFKEGAASILGQQAQRGAEKAVEWINEAGGIAGQTKMELTVKDEGSNAVDKYNQFIESGKNVTFGPISSGTHKDLFPKIETNQVVNVGTDGTVTSLYEGEDPTYSFRFQNYDVMEVMASVFEILERVGAGNVNTIAGVNPGYSFGKDVTTRLTYQPTGTNTPGRKHIAKIIYQANALSVPKSRSVSSQCH